MYRQKEIFEARQLTAGTRDSIKEWAGNKAWFYGSNGESELYFATDQGGVCAQDGWWIVRGEAGGYLVYPPEEFAASFEPVESTP